MAWLRGVGKGLIRAVLVSSLVTATTAWAAGPKPDASARDQAKAAMRRGMSAFAAGDADTALSEYQRAQKLAPDANIPYRYAAEALIKLGRYQEAVDSLQRYIELTPDASDADAIRAKIEELRSRNARSTLTVRCEPKGAQVFVDDGSQPIGQTPLESVQVAPGKHTIRVQAPHHDDATLSIDIKPAGHGELTCSLTTTPRPSTPTAPPPVAEPPAFRPQARAPAPAQQADSMRLLGWVGLGAGAATLLTGALLDSTWLGTAVDNFHSSVDAEDARALSWKNKAENRRMAVGVIYGAGALVTLTGVTLLLWPRSVEKRSEALRSGLPLLGLHPSGIVLGWSRGF
jgi:tetratricopeptide (TPR) repeat protein